MSGPTTSSFDSIYRVADNGDVETFYRGLGRPQGMAFDAEGNLYSAASHMGRKGVVRITPDREADLFVSGTGDCGAGVFAIARDDHLDDECDLSRGCGDSRLADSLGEPTPGMNAEIIAVGSEMLTHKRVDTNSLFLTEQLNNLGVEVTAKHVIGDDLERLAGTIRRAMGAAEVVILSGGLGPTEDDLTRDAVAMALDRRQVFNAAINEGIEQRFRQMNRAMPEINRRQAMVIEGAHVLPNDRGTAPGQWIEDAGAYRDQPARAAARTAVDVHAAVPAAAGARRAAAGNPHAGTAHFGDVGIGARSGYRADLQEVREPGYHDPGAQRRHAGAPAGAMRDGRRERWLLLAEVGGKIDVALGDRIYSHNGDPLEAVVGKQLAGLHATLAVAESATGGGLAERITSVPGSSAWFLGGFVTYTRRLKVELLGVPAEVIDRFGAVSAETAEAMALGARRRTGATWALSVTGNAGPTTDGEQAPVGMIHVGLSGPAETDIVSPRLANQ